MEVSGVRSSWETLAMKSRRLFSMRSVSVRSRSTATAPPPSNGVRARGPDDLVARRILNRGEKVRVADAVDQRRIQAQGTKQQTVHAPIGPLDAPLDIDRDHRVLHAVEKSFQLALAGLNASVTFLHPPCRLIQG